MSVALVTGMKRILGSGQDLLMTNLHLIYVLPLLDTHSLDDTKLQDYLSMNSIHG
jgi:hypothetical protein